MYHNVRSHDHGGDQCTVTATLQPCPPSFPNSNPTLAIINPGTNANCSGMGSPSPTGMATRTVAQTTPPHICGFTFSKVCTLTAFNFITTNVMCTVDSSDGLPIELMSFSFEDDEPHEAESGEASTDPEG